MRRQKKYMICEAPVSVGSPTRGTEDAYRHLIGNGLPELLGDRAKFCDFGAERTVPEARCDPRLHHLETVMHVCRENRRNVLKALADGYVPVTLGGDHSLVMSSVAALAETVRNKNFFDTRNFADASAAEAAGFKYYLLGNRA